MANDILSGAGSGAALGATIGTAVPVIGNAVGAVGGAIIGAGVGLAKSIKRRRDRKKLDKAINNNPKYGINDEAYDNQAIARAGAFGRDRSMELQGQKIDQNASDAAAAAKDVSSSTSSLLSTITAINANKNASNVDLAQNEAALQNTKKQQLIGVNNQLIDEKDKAWNYNKNMPYQMKVASLRDRIKSNDEQSSQESAQAMSAVGGMFGGGGSIGGGGGGFSLGRAGARVGGGGSVGGSGWVPSNMKNPL